MLDIDKFLEPISEESPCGEDLEYDPDFLALEQAAEDKPDQQFGDTVIEAQSAEWKNVAKLATSLTERTRDLRILILLARAELNLEGFSSFAKVVELISKLVEGQWDHIHPQLDPDDDNDPTMRLNALSELSAPATFLKDLKNAPMVKSKIMGMISYQMIDAALNAPPPDPKKKKKDDDDEPSIMDTSSIDAAFKDAELEDIKRDAAAVAALLESLPALEASVTDKLGVGNGINLKDLKTLLDQVKELYTDKLEMLGVFDEDPEEDDESEDGAGGSAKAAAKKQLAGEILSRDDVIKAIDKICKYYRINEPSSPVPLILGRCRKLVSLSFLEILEDLAPEGIQSVTTVAGSSSEEE